MKHVISSVVSLLLFGTTLNLTAQGSRKVLFLGNSYTYVNNLPQLVHDVALSAGDTLIFDSNAPGSYQLIDHSLNTTTQNKIMAGGWDHVVLQGQSQEPVVASSQFLQGAAALCSLIRQYNPCAVIMPYMTWGRKNGDASTCSFSPIMCTYEGMDTTLRDRYLDMTESINGEVSPVSVVWKYLRQNHPGIELYQPDESHPSVAGTYAAACCFYAAIFKKDPTLITFNFGLNASDAAIIRNAAKIQVFDTWPQWDFKKPPVSVISYHIGSGSNQVLFSPINMSGVRQTYLWDFGDGVTSTTMSPSHSYAGNGTYTVSLTTTTCDLQGLHTAFSDTIIQFCSHTPTVYTTHGWLCHEDTLWTQAADAYQWFLYSTPLPETNQYVADFEQYGSSGLSVISSIGGCSELSAAFSENPEWSGYYFDGMGNPCVGDTVAFAVLHTNGSLSGSETILWYRNDTLLTSMTNEDTLLITGSGTYECRVINSNSNCPIDTTYAALTYNCGAIGMNEKEQGLSWIVFPNPASESVTIKFPDPGRTEEVHIYTAIGRLVKVSEVRGATTLDITDLPNGFYFIRLKNNKRPPLKFIKQ